VLHACQRVFCFYGLLALWGLCAHLYEHPPTNSTLSSIWAPTVGRTPPPLTLTLTLNLTLTLTVTVTLILQP
jgi:hypothetical protein